MTGKTDDCGHTGARAPGCIRHEIGSCLAPCAAGCTRNDYTAAARAARAFLEGADTAPLNALERDMHAAAAAMQFERAAALRDRIRSLKQRDLGVIAATEVPAK